MERTRLSLERGHWLTIQRSGFGQQRINAGVAIERLPAPGRGVVAPIHQLLAGVLERLHRRTLGLRAAPRLAPRQPRQRAPQRFGPRVQLPLKPQIEGSAPQAVGFRLGELFEVRIDARFHRTLAQDLRAEAVDGADGRFFQTLQRVFEVVALLRIGTRGARFVEFLAQPDLQLAGRFVGEGHGHNLVHRCAGGQHAHDAPDQLGGLARAGGSFHDQALAEGVADALARGFVMCLRG